jgi:hypothetical protein
MAHCHHSAQRRRALRATSSPGGANRLGTSHPLAAVSLLVAASLLGGCTKHVPMAQMPEGEKASTIIHYTSVTKDVRRFADYGSVDRSILAPAAMTGP